MSEKERKAVELAGHNWDDWQSRGDEDHKARPHKYLLACGKTITINESEWNHRNFPIKTAFCPYGHGWHEEVIREIIKKGLCSVDSVEEQLFRRRVVD